MKWNIYFLRDLKRKTKLESLQFLKRPKSPQKQSKFKIWKHRERRENSQKLNGDGDEIEYEGFLQAKEDHYLQEEQEIPRRLWRHPTLRRPQRLGFQLSFN